MTVALFEESSIGSRIQHESADRLRRPGIEFLLEMFDIRLERTCLRVLFGVRGYRNVERVGFAQRGDADLRLALCIQVPFLRRPGAQ